MAGNLNDNPFRRYAYSPRHRIKGETVEQFEEANSLDTFTGGDLSAYINNIKVANLESVTWSTSVETMGNYVMGRRDAVTYTTGKRVIVGSMVFTQFNKHVILEAVFQMSKRRASTVGDLWSPDINVAAELVKDQFTVTAPGGVNTAGYVEFDPTQTPGSAAIAGFGQTNSQLRGLSPTEMQRQLTNQLRETARLIGATKLNYSDQLPPFDLTLIGVNKMGSASRCMILGMQITQETAGFTQNDLGNQVGIGFVALGTSPWRPIELDGGSITIPPGA